MAASLQKLHERFQLYMEKLKVAEYTQLNKVYGDINKMVTSVVNELNGEISDLRRAELNRFIGSVVKQQKAMMDKALASSVDRMKSFSVYSYELEAAWLHKVTGAAIAHAAQAREVYKAALDRPLGATGDLLKPFIENTVNGQVVAMEKTLRKASVNGWTDKETLQAIKGTSEKAFADGLLSRFGKQNATMVRTAMQHINNVSYSEVWAENKDVVSQYQWVSVLDDRTSDICVDLDGEVFDIGDGPVPPAHPNCRSITVAILHEDFAELSEGRTRSSEEGYIDADTTFSEWQDMQEGEGE
jgi:SPP1 gp7 family putative phage head morphogenesis protein